MINLISNNVPTDPIRVDRFPYKSKTIHTIGIRTSSFIGTLTIQGSLSEDNPVWFEVFILVLDGTQAKKNFMFNFVGCPVLMKVEVSENALGRVDEIIIR